MTLPSRHWIGILGPDDLRPSTLPVGHEARHNIDSSRVSGEETLCFFETWRPKWGLIPRSPTFQAGSFNHFSPLRHYDQRCQTHIPDVKCQTSYDATWWILPKAVDPHSEVPSGDQMWHYLVRYLVSRHQPTVYRGRKIMNLPENADPNNTVIINNSNNGRYDL